MGKKRIVKGAEEKTDGAPKAESPKSVKRRIEAGILFVQSTYNNTLVSLSDTNGNIVAQSSSGALGFKGAKKGTPFAAAKVGEILGTKAQALGLKEVSIIVKGVGTGRESAIRSFAAKNITISSIKDSTPVPFNGPRRPKPRRV